MKPNKRKETTLYCINECVRLSDLGVHHDGGEAEGNSDRPQQAGAATSGKRTGGEQRGYNRNVLLY